MKKTILRECIRCACARNERIQHLDFRHFSFVVVGNKIISCGNNVTFLTPKTGMLYPKYRGYTEVGTGIHSEVFAYKKARGLLNGADFEIVNVRVTNRGDVKLSKPCPCCVQFLKQLGCTRVWFSTEAGMASLRLR